MDGAAPLVGSEITQTGFYGDDIQDHDPAAASSGLGDVALAITPSEAAKRVAHRIRTSPEGWDQLLWVSHPSTPFTSFDFKGCHVYTAAAALNRIQAGDCGTTACVAGWAVIEALDAGAGIPSHTHIRDAARSVLGLSSDDADDLFKSSNSDSYVLSRLDQIASEAGV